MDNDKAALEAALAEYEALMKAAILPADPATFKAAWHRALAYMRQGMEPAAWLYRPKGGQSQLWNVVAESTKPMLGDEWEYCPLYDLNGSSPAKD